MDSLKASDALAASVAVAPRVKLSDIEAAIAARFDVTADDAVRHGAWTVTDQQAHVTPMLDRLRILSICILVMKNGYTVIGKSVPASPANFDRDLGKAFAYDDAVRQLWPLMGFALRDRLAAEQA